MRFRPFQFSEDHSWFQRACAVLCLLLLMFSVAHTAFGHSGALTLPFQSDTATHLLQPESADTPDTCAVCVAMTTIVVLAVLTFTAAQLARPRPAVLVPLAQPEVGWHTPLFSRPPPVSF